MAAKTKQEAQNPLILRCHRLIDAFAKSDDERDFYIDRLEGFLVYVDLDKPQPDLENCEKELRANPDRYCPIPKLSFYETKKIMEGFVNEKVYDIDTKEKLLDIIQSKEARENFVEFIYDHHAEQEKWQQFYQERSRIRIIEWLRQNHFHFVFEEDLDLPKPLVEKLKQSLFLSKVSKEIQTARKTLVTRAKTYYSNEALNPRPKRGRPPKQVVKLEVEPQVTLDIYTTVPPTIRPFLFTPELHTSSTFSPFSSKFQEEDPLFAGKKTQVMDSNASLSQKLAALRSLSSRWTEGSAFQTSPSTKDSFDSSLDDEDDDDDELSEIPLNKKKSQASISKKSDTEPTKSTKEKSSLKKEKGKTKIQQKKLPVKASSTSTKNAKGKKPKVKRIMPLIKQTKPATKKLRSR